MPSLRRKSCGEPTCHDHGTQTADKVMATRERRGSDSSNTEEWKEREEGDVVGISFFLSQKTASAWRQLKRDKCLQDCELAAFLLDCYRSSLQSATCPQCRCTLQLYCSRCTQVVVDSRDGHSYLRLAAGLRSTSAGAKKVDTGDVEPARSAQSAPTRRKSNPARITGAKTTKRRRQPTRSNDLKNRYISVHSNSDGHWDHADGGDDDDDDDNGTDDWRTEPRRDSADDPLEEYSKNQIEAAEDEEAAFKTEGSPCDAAGEKAKAALENVEAEKDIQKTCLSEAVGARSRSEASVHTVDDVGNVDSTSSPVKIEFQASDNEEGTESPKHSVSKLSKPDIVSCAWCDVSFKSVMALTRHLTVHTTKAWQNQHVCARYKATDRRRPVNSTGRTCQLRVKTSVRKTRSQEQTSVKQESVDFDEGDGLLTAKGQGVFCCLLCGVRWKTPVGLTHHIRCAHIKQNTYRCLPCGKTFSSLRSLAFHLRTHPMKRVRDRDPATHPHQCGRCGRRFVHVGSLARHMERHAGPGQFWCSRCQCRFQSVMELTGHQCRPPSPEKEDSDRFEDNQIPNVSPLSSEKGNSEEKPGAADINQFSEAPVDTADRQDEKVAPGKAAENEVETKKPTKRGRKRKETVLTLQDVKRPYQCPSCPAAFMHASVLKVHAQKHSGQKAFPCPQCHQSFPSKSRCYQHQEKDHWGSTPITCHQCGKVFVSARSLDEHRVVHTGERPYSCDTCGEAFPSRGALTRHRRTHRASYFKCQDCGAEFHLKSRYKHHMDEHRAVRPHLCSHCGQAFHSLSVLKEHVERHGEKRFICELCGKAFCKKGEHKMHLMTHQSVKPFPCPQCDRSFISRSKLRLHNNVTHLQLKPYSCDQCEAAFTSATYLKDHVRFAHTTERPFACSLCLSRFAAKRFLNLHLKRTHKSKRDVESVEGGVDSRNVTEQSVVTA